MNKRTGIFVFAALLIMLVAAIIMGSSGQSTASAITPTPTVENITAPVKTPIPVPSATPALSKAEPGIYAAGDPVITFMYRLDDDGKAIWSQAGEIPVGALVKRGTCIDGYAQVEYNSPEKPNAWTVEFVECGP